MPTPLRIGFISHEFPPDTGGGGIGTYLDQITALLSGAGHAVEVFCGTGRTPGSSIRPDGVQVHRLAADTAEQFRAAVVPVFTARHALAPFDVIEANDFDAPANAIKHAHPGLPCVIKLHTPRFYIDELHQRAPTLPQRTRMLLGALRRGQWPQAASPIRSSSGAREELAALALADEIAAPSQAVAEAAQEWVPAITGKISVFPYPYIPPPALLAIPAGGTSRRVTYLGRLEQRKGVIDLVHAIPAVLSALPETRFRFIGRAMPSPRAGQDMRAYLEARLGPAALAVEFTGQVAPAALPHMLAETDLLVAPSHWESFGLVCCEGLAAARAVIGSSAGGMAEILEQGRCGALVPPHEPARLAEIIIGLLPDESRRRQLGELGRDRILRHYSASAVLAAQVASYGRAVARRTTSRFSSS
jgi:glycosyltransferase involved in cell wall biosynthesis